MTAIPANVYDDFLCRPLRGEDVAWPAHFVVDDCIEQAEFHGIYCLLHAAIGRIQDLPDALRSRLQLMTRQRAVWELREQRSLHTALAALAAHGIKVLVFKGSALAHTHYANPVWRTRGDSDLLVAATQAQQAASILHTLGYQEPGRDLDHSGYQSSFEYEAPEGGLHSIDLHWQLNNSELLSGLFTMEELWLRSRSLPVPGAAARTPEPVDALLIACVHRGVHKMTLYQVNDSMHYTGDRLIWLYDLDLLVRGFSLAEWECFVQRACAKGIAQCCAESLQLAARYFGTPLPAQQMARLLAASAGEADRYLGAGPFRRDWLDLRANPGWRAQVDFCRHQLFPPPGYMRSKYASAHCRWLPWLYIRRFAEGLARYCRLSRATA